MAVMKGNEMISYHANPGYKTHVEPLAPVETKSLVKHGMDVERAVLIMNEDSPENTRFNEIMSKYNS